MKRALVLAGGGARGAYQVGMLRELVLNQGLDFQVIRGVSAGALNAALLAQAPSQPDPLAALKTQVLELADLWTREIQGNEDVFEKRTLGALTLAFGADSLYDTAPLRRLIEKVVSVERLRTSGRYFTVGAVSLVSGAYKEYGPEDPSFLARLVASAAIPVVFPFVDFAEERDVLVDGGTRNITPLGSVFRSGADEVYVLLTSRLIREGNRLPDSAVKEEPYSQWKDNALGTKVTALDVLRRAVDILTDELYLSDLKGAIDWNRVAAVASEPSAEMAPLREVMTSLPRRKTPIYILAPREWYGTTNAATEFEPALIRKAIEHGESVARDRTLWVWPP